VVRGSDDYHWLYFWGTGSTWDARNEAIIDADQPGTAEPNVDELKAAGLFWPTPSVIAPTSLELTAYPNTGVVPLTVTISNPTDTAVDLTVSLATDSPAFSLPATTTHLEPRSTAPVQVDLDTAQLAPNSQAAGILSLSHDPEGELAAPTIVITTPATEGGDPQSCADAAAARQAPDLPAEQVAPLDAYLAACHPNSLPVAVADTATATVGGPAVSINPLTNDTDADGDAISLAEAAIIEGPGSVTTSPGVVVFTPPSTGGDSTTKINYTITDPSGGRATGIITVTTKASTPPPPPPPSLTVQHAVFAAPPGGVALDGTLPASIGTSTCARTVVVTIAGVASVMKTLQLGNTCTATSTRGLLAYSLKTGAFAFAGTKDAFKPLTGPTVDVTFAVALGDRQAQTTLHLRRQGPARAPYYSF
jgi:Bacterial Ig domain